MILHLPMMFVSVPAVVSMFFEIIIPIAMFDLLENDYGINTSLFLNYDDAGQESIPWFNNQLQDLGYGNHNLIENLNTLIIIFVLYFVQLILILFFWLLVKLLTYFKI